MLMADHTISDAAIDWLLAGDPVIRWQTMRDLLLLPEPAWQAERERTLHSGWGAKFLDCLQEDGRWPDGRWTGTIWTLLTIMDCGLPQEHPRLQTAAEGFVDRMLTPEPGAKPDWLLTRIDLCHIGFWLRIGAYFSPNDKRLAEVAQVLLAAQMQDGGWNCRKRKVQKTHHSSFHTTFNILEGLCEAAMAGIIPSDVFHVAEARAMEFMLRHKMYRSDKTGAIVNDRFLHLTYPSHWHYTVLRGLDYMHITPEIADSRLEDSISQIMSRRGKNGRWTVEKRIPGTTLFEMEKWGGESRWNTLKALRVLRGREQV